MNREANPSRRAALADRLALAVFLLGVAARVWGAWATRFLVVPDTAVVGLMARHMAALKELPIFFYGQAYMGSLEPMASAVWVRVLGSSGFAVNLGPVLFAAAALYFLWRWARDAAGPWGGVAALVAGLFGPPVYFQFQMAPRGGYMVALFVDALAIFAAARMAARLRAGEDVRWGRYFGLGVLAGLGMWSNLIVVSALAAAALLLAHGMRWKLWRHVPGIAAGLAGFVLGFAPWLGYNVRHGWASLDMSQISGHEPLTQALRSSWERYLMLQNAEIGLPGSQWPLILALAGLALAGAGAAVALAQGRRATLRENYARAGALVFCAIFAVVFATSGFTRTPTARYWVPLVPGLAVLSAVASAAAARRAGRGAAWGLLGLLALAQGVGVVASVRAYLPRAQATHGAYLQIGQALDGIGVDALMAPIQLFPLNFALEERVRVSNGKQKFYEPILRGAELAEAPAYASDFNGIETFLRQHAAQSEAVPAGGRRLLWNVRRTGGLRREIPADATASLRDGAGAEWAAELQDRQLDTGWAPGTGKDAVLEWTFAAPQDIEAIQLVFSHGMAEEAFDFPRRIRIEVKQSGEWRSLLAEAPLIPLEWSGPRVYFPSGFARPEFRVAEAGVEALRVALLDTQTQGRSMGWRLAELNAYAVEPGGRPALEAGALEEAVRALPPETMVYAPRWLSNRMLKRGWVPEARLPGLAARVFDSTPETPREGTIRPDWPAVYVVEPPHAAATRATLDALGVPHRAEEIGGWTLFSVAADGWAADGLDLPPAAMWTGDALLMGNSAARVGEALRRLRAGGGAEAAEKALLDEIVRWRPSALSALPAEQVLRLGGESALQVRRAEAQFPAEPCATTFANGIRLEGVAVDPADVPAGGEVAVQLYWSAEAGLEAGEEVVFIHLRDAGGTIVAQDDYRGSPLLWGSPLVRPPAGECVVETRRLGIPATAAPGPVSLSVGLYQPKNGRRVKVDDTQAPEVRRNAVVWPEKLRISR